MKKNHETAKILNAIRMGVIPDANLSKLVVGREQEIHALNELLENVTNLGISNVKFIKGAYGSGKTFLMNYLAQMALEKNFVVVTLSINSGFYLTRLDSFYTECMNKLQIKDKTNQKGTSFEEIFDLWIKNLKKDKGLTSASKDIYEVISALNEYNNAFAMVLLTYIRAKINHDYELSTIAASWIKGDHNISYELKKQLKVKGSVDSENAMSILRGFAHLIHLIGYSGMVILIDEAELIMNNRIDLRQKAYENIRYMMDLCGSSELERCLFAFCGTDELFSNEEKGFKSYEALNQRIGSNLNDKRNEPINYLQPIIELKKITREQWVALTITFLNLHQEQYGYQTLVEAETLCSLVVIECNKLNGNNPASLRSFLKKLMEILDVLHKNPELPIFNTKINLKGII